MMQGIPPACTSLRAARGGARARRAAEPWPIHVALMCNGAAELVHLHVPLVLCGTTRVAAVVVELSGRDPRPEHERPHIIPPCSGAASDKAPVCPFVAKTTTARERPPASHIQHACQRCALHPAP
jgi:hypothetical protein